MQNRPPSDMVTPQSPPPITRHYVSRPVTASHVSQVKTAGQA